jgi:stage III sporulation protein AF
MLEFLKDWIGNIVTVTVIMVIIEIMLPSGKTKKFINVVSGFIILAVIMNPVIDVIGKGITQKDYSIINERFLNIQEIKQNSGSLDEKQIKQVIKVYRANIKKHIENVVQEIDNSVYVNADVIINENHESVSFGIIRKIYLDIIIEDKSNKIKPVEPVVIEKIEPGIEKNIDMNEKPEENKWQYIKETERKLAELFDIDNKDIIISIKGS